jgi:fatty-acyl-CoA synthase
MNAAETIRPVNAEGSPAKAWMRALELTASIARQPERVMPVVMDELGVLHGDAPALLSDLESFSYRELAERTNQYARWALANGVAKGDVVALLMANRPEYFAIWLGITRVGGVVALLNTNLIGPSLLHCIDTVKPKYILVDSGLAEPLQHGMDDSKTSPAMWVHGADVRGMQRIDEQLAQYNGEKLTASEQRTVTVKDWALYIFTSGTTGLPKAANVSHARVMQWTHWFAGMMGVQPADRMYDCLPMYHSIGGVLVPGAMLVGGGSVVIREKFSASQFWADINRWDCTIFQYIGEFCRYLLHAAPSVRSQRHRIRLACGNGLTPDVWDDFKRSFRIPQILEFYAATEGAVSLFNAEGQPGAIGRVPPYLAHRFSPALVKFDVETGEPVRNEQGFCIRCDVNEAGEALARCHDDPAHLGSRFDGYTDTGASAKKILRDVFQPGDTWVRTGDLMRKDGRGFYYFVDRIGDTFRWKGENVATTEVAEVLCAFPGVQHASVYGVRIPDTEGRAGMAAIVADQDLDLRALREHLVNRLPTYARPLFVRRRVEIEVTGTFKYSKTELAREGYNPGNTTDAIYFNDPRIQEFRKLDARLHEQIQNGHLRL